MTTTQATAIYQASQKLESIKKANRRKLSTDELIKYAHAISASHAVAAPPTWMPGKVTVMSSKATMWCQPRSWCDVKQGHYARSSKATIWCQARPLYDVRLGHYVMS